MTEAMSAAADANATSFTDCIFFYEDEVFRVLPGPRPVSARLQMGMVVENAEYASSDDEDDSGQEPPEPTSDDAFANGGSDEQQRQRNESEVTEHGSVAVDSAEKLRPGHVRVAWFPRGNEEIVGQDKVRVMLPCWNLVFSSAVASCFANNSAASGRLEFPPSTFPQK
jgi:hypothetical protein